MAVVSTELTTGGTRLTISTEAVVRLLGAQKAIIRRRPAGFGPWQAVAADLAWSGSTAEATAVLDFVPADTSELELLITPAPTGGDPFIAVSVTAP